MTIPPEERADQLLQELRYESWRPGQREAVIATLEGRDSLIVMPTGGGKSLCYQLPGLATPDLTIVVSPLIALMRDQWDRLIAKGHPVAMVSSGMSGQEVREALAEVRAGARLVYCAPERFWSGDFLDALAHRKIDLIAVDEAHCVSEWGHDFRPDYLRLPAIAGQLGRPTVMACTATATEQVAAEIAARFKMHDPLQVRAGFDRRNLTFDVVSIEGPKAKARRQAILELGLDDPAKRPAIVYCGTRRDTERVAAELRQAGLDALPYHAGMEAEHRTSVQDKFMSGKAEVIVATIAFGMGVDKPDVRSVWHVTIPTSLEAYYQEAGRAGRDGKPARVILLAVEADLTRLRRFNAQRAGDPALAIAYERGCLAYEVIRSFVYSDRCRRRALLDHFSDRAAGAPLNRCCDICDPEAWPWDRWRGD
jgi:ATP-dependent DNA helicase RecQ